MPKVTYHFNNQVKTVETEKGQSVLHIALDNGIPMETACGGNGICTTCMCTIKKGMENLSPRNDREENMGVTDDPMRLGCQSLVEGDGDVEVEVTEY